MDYGRRVVGINLQSNTIDWIKKINHIIWGRTEAESAVSQVSSRLLASFQMIHHSGQFTGMITAIFLECI